ncbi:MAG: hypothetical protein NTX59_08415 [Elusimicrobia bacterium]|nr:hypothetical protein [Elusimicrobiota bacterium]
MQEPNEDLSWIKKLDEKDIAKHFTNDITLIYEHCGLEVLIKLWEKLASINLYLSEKPLMAMRREYIHKNYVKTNTGNNAKELAVLLHVSEQYVYIALKDNSGSLPDDPKLFPNI